VAEAPRRARCPYVVGGFVRDLLLGSPVKRLCLVVEGDAIVLPRLWRGNTAVEMTAHVPALERHNGFFYIRMVTHLILSPPAGTKTPGLCNCETPVFWLMTGRRDFNNQIPWQSAWTGSTGGLRMNHGLNDSGTTWCRVLPCPLFQDDPTRLFRRPR